ncbi:Pentatricopeptide repeat-containing protein [Abeliophyllum distichum]|uniref:Pentatricopeptide repeat-containing protein n=1 Tax=Abeliophyllum distichum TaxID=126358 RepID=A0ABD1RR72_9LAMI
MLSLVSDSFTFLSVLLAYGGLGEIDDGQIVHGLVEKIGIKKDVIVSNGLLSMNFKLDRLMECWGIFNEMVVKDTVTWNTMICGYSESGLYKESIGLFLEMVSQFEPHILTITSVLWACTYIGDLKFGRYVDNYMVKNGYDCDTMAGNIIINMHAKCGDLLGSRRVFESMRTKDLVSWNSLMNGYIENGLYYEAMELFRRMRMDLQRDSVTYVTLLSNCTQLINIEWAKELHCDLIKQGFDFAQIVGNALVDVFAKCGAMEDSLKQFENMEIRDIVSWNTIIAASGHYKDSNLGSINFL